MNDELAAPGLDIIVPDITKACPMSAPGLLSIAQRYQKLWRIILPSQLVQPGEPRFGTLGHNYAQKL